MADTMGNIPAVGSVVAVGVAVVLVGVVGPVATAWADPAPAMVCAPTVMLAVDGTKGPSTPDSIDPKSPVNAYTDRYEGHPGYVIRHVRYPGGMIAGINGWDTNLDDSVTIGSDRLRREIATIEAVCGPASRYELFGYSQGALVVRRVATEIDIAEPRDGDTDLRERLRVHLIADPAQGVPSRYPGELIPGITLPDPAEPFQYIPITTECLPRDIVCDPNGDVIGYATQHSSYRPVGEG